MDVYIVFCDGHTGEFMKSLKAFPDSTVSELMQQVIPYLVYNAWETEDMILVIAGYGKIFPSTKVVDIMEKLETRRWQTWRVYAY